MSSYIQRAARTPQKTLAAVRKEHFPMQIVPQTVSASYSLFYPPLLALPAPRIVGFLTAWVPSTDSDPYSEPPTVIDQAVSVQPAPARLTDQPLTPFMDERSVHLSSSKIYRDGIAHWQAEDAKFERYRKAMYERRAAVTFMFQYNRYRQQIAMCVALESVNG